MGTARRFIWLTAALLPLVFVTCSTNNGDDVDVGAWIQEEAANVTTNSAYVVVGYTVSGAKILEAGCVYSKSEGRLNRENIEAYSGSPTADFGIVSGGVSASLRFPADLTGLDDGTTYYYKPYVKIDKSTDIIPKGYFVPSEYKSFTTLSDNRPAVSMDTVINISRTGATFNATVRRAGDPSYTGKGFCYGTVRNPAEGNSTVKEIWGTSASFTFTAADLVANTTYYVRAYIENVDGRQYSEEKTFTTPANTLPSVSIGEAAATSKTAATFTATVVNAGDPEYTEKGFCYGTARNPAKGNGTAVEVSGTTAAFTFTASDLAANTTYYVRAYIENGVGATQYSEEKTFKTPANTLPSVTIGDAAATSRTTATFTATVVNAGDPEYTEKGFCYGTVRNPAKGNSTVEEVSGTTAAFTFTVSDLAANTTYYVRAYIENGVGATQYSEEKTFKTPANTLPSVTIGEAAATSRTTATFAATVVNAGDPAYTEKGFCYGTVRNPAKGNSSVKNVSGATVAFTSTVSDLAVNTTYYVRAYIENEIGAPQYSAEKTFTTPANTPPSVSNVEVAVAPSGTAATFTAAVVEPGDPKYTGRGFCYGTSPNPRKSNSTVKPYSGTGEGTFSQTVDLTDNTKYYVCAYIDGTDTTLYSAQKEFETPYTDFTKPFKDNRDGKTYRVQMFGSDLWMIDNFKGGGSTTGYYSWQQAFEVCPEGWHLPNVDEWAALYLILKYDAADYFIKTGGWWTANEDDRYFAIGIYVEPKGNLQTDVWEKDVIDVMVRYVKD